MYRSVRYIHPPNKDSPIQQIQSLKSDLVLHHNAILLILRMVCLFCGENEFLILGQQPFLCTSLHRLAFTLSLRLRSSINTGMGE